MFNKDKKVVNSQNGACFNKANEIERYGTIVGRKLNIFVNSIINFDRMLC